MENQDDLANRIGLIAIAQARLDEWLVQVLICLLKPISESRVQLLVGDRSLDAKCTLVKKLATNLGIPLDDPLPSGAIPSQVLKQASQLNSDRDRAVHSYYDWRADSEVRRFRSRRPKVEEVNLDDLSALAEGLMLCGDNLGEFVNYLERTDTESLGSGAQWGEVIRGVHEVIVAGHLHERKMLGAVADGVESKSSVRLALRGASRRVLREGEQADESEFTAEISTTNWLATITSPRGEVVRFGDTGWRDVTELARDEDPEVQHAVIRRMGDIVQLSVEGGEMSKSPWPQVRDRLAERAFGPDSEPDVKTPSWVLGLKGFAPDDQKG